MFTIAIQQGKGGPGKSTTACHLAAAAARLGLSTFILDTDPRAASEDWAGVRGDHSEKVIVKKLPAAQVPVAIKKLEEAGVQLCIIDTEAAAVASSAPISQLADLILIPSRTTRLDLHGVKQTVTAINLVPGALKKARLIVTQVHPSRFGVANAEKLASTVKDAFGIDCLGQVKSLVGYQYAMDNGRDIVELAPQSSGAMEMKELSDKVLKMGGLI